MRCGDLRRVEKSCENLKSWDEMRWQKLRWHEKRWEQLWSAEKSWERERRHRMRWDEMRWGEKIRRHEMSWDEMGWRRLRWQRVAMSNFQEKLRCDEIRWNEERFNNRKTWHQIDKSGACCCDAQEACLSPIGAAFAPLYRLYAFQIWNFRPRLARELFVQVTTVPSLVPGLLSGSVCLVCSEMIHTHTYTCVKYVALEDPNEGLVIQTQSNTNSTSDIFRIFRMLARRKCVSFTGSRNSTFGRQLSFRVQVWFCDPIKQSSVFRVQGLWFWHVLIFYINSSSIPALLDRY